MRSLLNLEFFVEYVDFAEIIKMEKVSFNYLLL
jgi:hypothetical protein